MLRLLIIDKIPCMNLTVKWPKQSIILVVVILSITTGLKKTDELIKE